MGNSESQPVRNMDKRTARREYRAQFEAGCNAYREEHADELCDETTDWSSEPIVVSGHSKRKIHVFARKRPIFQHEIDDGEFDCVTCLKGGITTVHDARMRNDMINQFMKHNEFKFHHSFSELDSNTTVYRGVASPLAQHAVLNGGHSTCMVYGQTGSGKTYTMTSVYEQACKEIFELVDEKKAAAEEDGKNVPQISVSVSFIEVAGEECHDLFNNFNTVQLAPGSDDSFHAYPIVEPVVTSAEECFALIMYGCGARATAATGVHDASSRSHAILRVYIRCGDGVGARNVVTEGVLTMVDLAGSEHRIDSMYHSAARRKEGAQINASLMTLKECIRAHGHNNAGHIYRKSALTKVLKGSFMLPNAVTHIIATVSPASKDTEHSLNTLRHACIMMNSKGKSTGGSNANSDAVEMEEETRFITGGHVYEVDLGRINIGAISKKNRDLKKQGLVPELKTSNGNKETSHGKSGKNNSYNHKVGAPSSSFGSEVNGGDKITATAAKMMSDELTEKEKIKMRKTNERAAFRKLTKEYRQCLVNARETIHDDSYYRQVDRMRGVYGIGGAPTPNVAVSDEVAAAEIRDRKKKTGAS